MARRRALVTAAFAAVTALVISAAPAEAAAPSYVALGDSYSSGTGTRSYLADGTSCLRSVYAYPSLIASAKGYALNFRACSGAKIADVSSTQLSALTSGTAYVTISVGGNDAGFADVLTTCAQPAWLSNCTGAVDRAQSYIRNTLPAALNTLYASIRARAPQAKVTVVGYPRIFNGEDCNLLTWFSPTEETPAQRHGRPDQLHHRRPRGGGRLHLRQPHLALRRARRVRQHRVDQRAVQPGRRVLPPQQVGALERVHADGQPLRHGVDRDRHGRPDHEGPRLRRPAGEPAARVRLGRPGDPPRGGAGPRPHDAPGAGRRGAGRGRPRARRSSIDAADRLWSARQAAELARR